MIPARYDEPFHWWGPGWETPTPRTIGELLRGETLDSATAALLWAALSRRASLAVAAGPGGAGKTTLLTALLDLLPDPTRRIYLRGNFESFEFLADPAVPPMESALLINEISPHLPIYAWGPAVARACAAAEHGFQLLATAHAASLVEFVALLTGSPLRVPAQLVAAFEFVAFLEPADTSPSGRRVREVCRLTSTAGGLAFESWLASPVDGRGQQSLPDDVPWPAWFPDAELQKRRKTLDQLRMNEISTLPE